VDYEAPLGEPEAWKISDDAFSAFIRLASPKINNSTWVQACARAHNREMHAAYGNTDDVNSFSTMDPLVALYRAQLWDALTIPAYDGTEVAVLVNKAAKLSPRLY